jgi:hypothetical protein
VSQRGKDLPARVPVIFSGELQLEIELQRGYGGLRC